VLKHLKNREDWSEKNVAEKGFTLIELLVVIAILGILAVVGVLAFGGFTSDAQTAVDKTELSQVKVAQSAYRAAHDDAFPPNVAALDQYIDGTSTALECTYVVTAAPVTQTC
jgi:prepilin-type N-terminal cleavage/methylation domain-containing protein